jgi:hypothetical protein
MAVSDDLRNEHKGVLLLIHPLPAELRPVVGLVFTNYQSAFRFHSINSNNLFENIIISLLSVKCIERLEHLAPCFLELREHFVCTVLIFILKMPGYL